MGAFGRRWAGYAAALWSLVYGGLGLYWALGGDGFPFGTENDPTAEVSILAGVRRETAAPVIAGLGLVSAVVALMMARNWGRGFLRWLLLGFAWIAAIALAVVVPDYRVLLALGYAPLVLIGAPFDWPPGVGLADVVPWPTVNLVICILGGLLWAATAVAYRSTDSARAEWTNPAATARWGRWATYVAFAVPVVYAVTRWAWALGIPLGITEEFLREGQAVGLWWAGAGLATLGVGGGILTLGLIRPWGEVFPRWIPFVAGRRVPPALAIVPAALVAVVITSAGLMFVRLFLFPRDVFAFNVDDPAFWGAIGPELLWPIWGVALGAATVAYFYRRRD